MDRVAVFVDYQNVYKGARGCFTPGSPSHIDGQVHPLKVGGLLQPYNSPVRKLVAVKVYRGMPSTKADPKGYSAAQRQISVWGKQKLVDARTRPINYSDPVGPREKGIDVMLAVDFVLMAARNEYDIGIIFSADTDLIPALEAVVAMKGDRAAEVAFWVPPYGSQHHSKPLTVTGYSLQRHGLAEAQYRLAHDPTDYTKPTRRR